jgi:hypothetical protein
MIFTAGLVTIFSPHAAIFGYSEISTSKNLNIHGIANGKYDMSATVGRLFKATYCCPDKGNRFSRIFHCCTTFAYNLPDD